MAEQENEYIRYQIRKVDVNKPNLHSFKTQEFMHTNSCKQRINIATQFISLIDRLPLFPFSFVTVHLSFSTSLSLSPSLHFYFQQTLLNTCIRLIFHSSQCVCFFLRPFTCTSNPVCSPSRSNTHFVC